MKMNNNKRQDTVLSIIVPVYNVEKYLKTRINSLLEQKLDAMRLYQLMMDQQIQVVEYVMSMQKA